MNIKYLKKYWILSSLFLGLTLSISTSCFGMKRKHNDSPNEKPPKKGMLRKIEGCLDNEPKAKKQKKKLSPSSGMAPVVGKIMDFLLTRDSLKDSRVSKEWQEAFKYVEKLEFDRKCSVKNILSAINVNKDKDYVNVKKLAFTGFRFFVDKWLDIAKGFSEMPNLKKLYLSYTDITGKALSNILQKCGKTLEDLDLRWCKNITSDEWLDIAKNFHKMPKLKKLNLNNTYITGEALLILLQKCPNLEILNLNECDSITAEEWLDIAKKCPVMPNLKILNLRWTFITDEAISILQKKCSNAKFLL